MLDIWSLARQQYLGESQKRTARQQESATSCASLMSNWLRLDRSDSQTSDTRLVICGSRNCGKTSMILRFLNRNEDAKSTIALEYTYGRRNRGKVGFPLISYYIVQVKDVGHIWELGGGTNLCNLLQIPLSGNYIQQCSIMIVIDLTAPYDMWNTFYTLLDKARIIVDNAMRQFLKKSSDSYEAFMIDRKTIFKEHKDAKYIDPFPIPLILLGAKYDEFQNFEPQQRKNICKFLRFMAHANGATLAMSSTKMESLVTKARILISSVVFGTTAPKTICTDHNKPLSVPRGADSLMDIGAPPLINTSLSLVGATNPRDIWREAFLELFPPKEKHNEVEGNPAEDMQHKEPEIDELIEQRTRELEQYMRHRKDRAALEAKMQQVNHHQNEVLGNL
uniref:Cytoplasmic dynein 2 light intermediate chain 1 n=1 Tax=Elaeophora elaphi TaxID=1147741 RepID=A0A158Q743_9BILA